MGKVTDKVRAWANRYISPVFLIMLILSFILWCLTKLGYTYTAEIPVNVNVAGNKFKVQCLAEGTGYRIFAHRYLKQKTIKLNFEDIQTAPSVMNEGNYVVNRYSLQNAISVRNTDLRIISVGDVPEIIY